MAFFFMDKSRRVDIDPDRHFNTPQLCVAEDEAEHYGVAPGMVIDHVLQHAPGAAAGYSAEDLKRYVILRDPDPVMLAPPSPPKTKRAGKGAKEVTLQTTTPTDANTVEIALGDAGSLSAVLAGADEPAAKADQD